jgi:hypothetical protein
MLKFLKKLNVAHNLNLSEIYIVNLNKDICFDLSIKRFFLEYVFMYVVFVVSQSIYLNVFLTNLVEFSFKKQKTLTVSNFQAKLIAMVFKFRNIFQINAQIQI